MLKTNMSHGLATDMSPIICLMPSVPQLHHLCAAHFSLKPEFSMKGKVRPTALWQNRSRCEMVRNITQVMEAILSGGGGGMAFLNMPYMVFYLNVVDNAVGRTFLFIENFGFELKCAEMMELWYRWGEAGDWPHVSGKFMMTCWFSTVFSNSDFADWETFSLAAGDEYSRAAGLGRHCAEGADQKGF